MNIPKAIEVLTRWKETGDWTSEEELAQAEQLGIEALKMITRYRKEFGSSYIALLSGETED